MTEGTWTLKKNYFRNSPKWRFNMEFRFYVLSYKKLLFWSFVWASCSYNYWGAIAVASTLVARQVRGMPRQPAASTGTWLCPELWSEGPWEGWHDTPSSLASGSLEGHSRTAGRQWPCLRQMILSECCKDLGATLGVSLPSVWQIDRDEKGLFSPSFIDPDTSNFRKSQPVWSLKKNYPEEHLVVLTLLRVWLTELIMLTVFPFHDRFWHSCCGRCVSVNGTPGYSTHR